MGPQRVLDGQLVPAELLLDLAQERRVRLVQADPHEPVGLAQDLADVGDGHLADRPPADVGDRPDDHAAARAGRPTARASQ